MTVRDKAAALALWVMLGCTDTGVVGERCNPSCDANQVCHATLAICVECIEDGDCTAGEGGRFCADFACVQCRASDDCAGDARVCVDGLCQQCATDLDCASGQICQSNRCAAMPDESEEETEEESGESDGAGDGAGEAGEDGN